MVGGAGQLKEITSPCILTPLTVFVDGFLNFSPVAPGNWAVTDVSSIEPEVSSSVAMIRTTMSKSQKRLKYQRNQLTISLCWNLNRLLCLISTHCHPLAHLLQQRDAFLEQSKTQSQSNRAGSTLYNYKSTLIIPIASCPIVHDFRQSGVDCIRIDLLLNENTPNSGSSQLKHVENQYELLLDMGRGKLPSYRMQN